VFKWTLGKNTKYCSFELLCQNLKNGIFFLHTWRLFASALADYGQPKRSNSSTLGLGVGPPSLYCTLPCISTLCSETLPFFVFYSALVGWDRITVELSDWPIVHPAEARWISVKPWWLQLTGGDTKNSCKNLSVTLSTRIARGLLQERTRPFGVVYGRASGTFTQLHKQSCHLKNIPAKQGRSREVNILRDEEYCAMLPNHAAVACVTLIL
jgi:hypothetical protein